MPVYEYKCKKCNKITEIMQKFSDEPLKSCQYCSGEVEKIISQSSFVLKGSGWYKTDYAKKKEPEKPVKKEECPAADKSPACAACPSSSEQ